jgi:hypothetical protein
MAQRDGWRSQSTWPTHLEESSILALFSHQASSIDLRRDGFALMQTLPELRQGWPLRFQSAMQSGRYVTKLNHL